MHFDFKKLPGKELQRYNFTKLGDPKISIIMPFYNDAANIKQTINSVLNQTYGSFELVIVNDGSTDKKSLKILEELKKLDNRIKIFTKKNEGPSAARDYGASKANKKSKYYFFLDSDDLIDKTYLECAYLTLETNKDASWAYADSVGFEGVEYTWAKWFDPERMKKENLLVATALIRKEDFWLVNGYELREKNISEDWNLWLKLLAKGKYPVRMNYYAFWYRRKVNTGQMYTTGTSNQKRAMEIINETVKTIKKYVPAIQYPKADYNWEYFEEKLNFIDLKLKKDNKKRLLVIVPWMVTGGADKFNVDFINGLNENYETIVISTQPAVNDYRQLFKDEVVMYDLSTFLDQKYWLGFINYIIEKNSIDLIINTNSRYGYSILPYIKAKYNNIPIIDYIHMEEWYNRNGGSSRDSSAVASVIDKTFTCNQKSEKILVDFFGRNPKELGTIYIGVDEKKFTNEIKKEDAKAKYGLQNKKVFGFICRIANQKRPLLLVEIVRKLSKELNDFVVLVGGDGDMLGIMKDKIKEYGLMDKFMFLGNTKDTKSIYSASDLTINCSIKEGLALTSYESLSMGVPVISSDVGGQGELIDDSVGVIVPCLQDEENINDFNYSKEEINLYVDGIHKILENLDNYSSKCRNRILKYFTIDKMIANMEKVIKDTINNPNAKKIENGKELNSHINMCKEYISQFLMLTKAEYEYLAMEYHNKLGIKVRYFNLRQYLWEQRWYRGIIKVLKKTGVIRLKKKMFRAMKGNKK